MRWFAVILIVSSIVASTWLGRAIHAGAATAPWASIVAGVWIASMVSVLIAARRRDLRPSATSEASEPQLVFTREPDPALAALAGLLIVGFVFRSTGLDRLPWGYAGVNLDAAYNSIGAFWILDGLPFTPVIQSRDVFTLYYLALSYAVGGRSIQTLRLACNLLGLFNCVLLFVILRRYTASLSVILGTTALYVLSGVDTIFALSGIEYIMTTPFILGSFVLFERARRQAAFGAAALAGLVWGLGLYSHYPYLFLLPVLPAIALVNFGTTRRWLSTFLVAGFVAAVPKLGYLAFNHAVYFARFLEVARHNPSGDFVVTEHFRQSAWDLAALLFKRQPHFKLLLPEDPVVLPLQIPLLALGLAISIRRLTRPEHFFAIAVLAFTVLVNLGAFVHDHRLINAMPVLFLLTGIGLLQLHRWLGAGRWARLVVRTLVSVLVVQSVSAYFADRDDPERRDPIHYGTDEVALARSIAAMPRTESPYALVPFGTIRLDFFNPARPHLRDLSAQLDGQTQQRYSRRGAEQVLQNVQEILRREAQGDVPVRFILSELSPYTSDVEHYLAGRPGVRTTALEVPDPVAHRSTVYRLVSITHPAAAVAKLPVDAGVLAATAEAPAASAIGKLWLKTFADTEERVLRDHRQVPAVLDFDFASRAPYSADWSAPFSLQWLGRLRVDHTADYRIEATHDDGCRIFLDDRLVLDDWSVGASRTTSATLSMEAGWHPLRIDYFQLASDAVLALRIAEGTKTAAAIAVSALASDAPAAQEAPIQEDR